MTLPTYNPDATCPQCASDDVETMYRDKTEYDCQTTYAPPAYDGAGPTCYYHQGPHFHRPCRRCGFRWAEAVGAPSMAMSPQ